MVSIYKNKLISVISPNLSGEVESLPHDGYKLEQV